MIIYKCKMCGGNLNIQEGSKVATCEYCQTQQTVPSADDEKRATLFNRANHFRQNSEFDKAMGIYEHILDEESNDAEAYWSIVLCKYGIEYVEDPVSKQQKPTINRTQRHSILQDADYLMALEKAEYSQRDLYEKEALEIDQIQKDILTIVKNESPYDIFISYKEKSSNGERTKSSVLAQDLYNRLENEGYRVFFSRISLEDKIGQKYEPYIYSALVTAKIMLVVATDKDEFAAPWVKNEWSRFLAMMREDAGKVLIPCFRELNIDELPNEFQILQCQDMSKIGYEQDLLHGIKKILAVKDKAEKKEDGIRSLDRLIQNADTYMNLHNYEAALKVYQDISKFYPEDYRGWWGLIQVNTNNFSDIRIASTRKHDFNKWFGYVKKLADETIYKDLQNNYIEYWKIASATQAEEEIASVQNFIKKWEVEKAGFNRQIDNISEEGRRRKQAFQSQDEYLQSQIEEFQNQSEQLYADAEEIRVYKGISWTILIASIVIGFIFVAGNEIAFGGVLFWIGGIIGIILIRSSRKRGSAYKKEEMAEDVSNRIEELKETRRLNKENYQKELIIINDKKLPYFEKIKDCDYKISAGNRYISLGINEISKLQFALDCRDIGVTQEINYETFILRDEVFNISKTSSNNLSDGERMEIPCYMCNHINNVFANKIRKNDNTFKCEKCGQIIHIRSKGEK